jgi:hypothetical protein
MVVTAATIVFVPIRPVVFPIQATPAIAAVSYDLYRLWSARRTI